MHPVPVFVAGFEVLLAVQVVVVLEVLVLSRVPVSAVEFWVLLPKEVPEVAVMRRALEYAAGFEALLAAEVVPAVGALVYVSVAEGGNYGPPKDVPFPNTGHYATRASFVSIYEEQSIHNTRGAHTSYDFCSTFSNQGLYRNKNLEHRRNIPIHRHNKMSDTSSLPIVSTTSRSRNINLCQDQE